MIISVSYNNEEALVLCLEDGCCNCPNKFMCLTHSTTEKSSLFCADVEIYNPTVLDIIKKVLTLNKYSGTVFDDMVLRSLNRVLKDYFFGTIFVVKYYNDSVILNCSIAYLSDVLDAIRVEDKSNIIDKYVRNDYFSI